MAKTLKDIIKTDNQISEILKKYSQGVSKLSMVDNAIMPSPLNHHTIDNKYSKDFDFYKFCMKFWRAKVNMTRYSWPKNHKNKYMIKKELLKIFYKYFIIYYII